MKNFVLILIISSFAWGCSKCGNNTEQESVKNLKLELSGYQEIQCRCVCDKKLSTLQKMTAAIEFYKNSKLYKFSN